jgi:hypothetical protein
MQQQEQGASGRRHEQALAVADHEQERLWEYRPTDSGAPPGHPPGHLSAHGGHEHRGSRAGDQRDGELGRPHRKLCCCLHTTDEQRVGGKEPDPVRDDTIGPLRNRMGIAVGGDERIPTGVEREHPACDRHPGRGQHDHRERYGTASR